MSGTTNPPDFDDMMNVSEKIKQLSLVKLSLENDIKELEVKTVLEVTSNEKYFKNGKAPAMNFIDSTYKITGLEGEISKKRAQLSEVISELDFCKREFDIMKGMLEVWRTESANMRASIL